MSEEGEQEGSPVHGRDNPEALPSEFHHLQEAPLISFIFPCAPEEEGVFMQISPSS